MFLRTLLIASLAYCVAAASTIDPPIVASAIIEIDSGEEPVVVLVERTHAPLGRALPGYRISAGESVEAALRRGVKQQLGCELSDIRLFQVYSDPTRDPINRSIEIVHIAKLQDDGKTLQRLGELGVCFKESVIPWDALIYDHAEIIRDYHNARNSDD